VGSVTAPKGYAWSIRMVGDFHINKLILYQFIKITSNQLAGTSRALVFLQRFFTTLTSLLFDHCPNWFFKDLFKALSCECAAFHILAFQFIFNDTLCSFSGNRSCLWVFGIFGGLVSKINLVSYKNFYCRGNNVLNFWIPLHKPFFTFFLAFENDDGSTTEKAIRKTSVPG
jgi:hypothetical protein